MSKRKGKDIAKTKKAKKQKAKKLQAKFILPEFIDKQALQNLYELEYGPREETSLRMLFDKSQTTAQRLNVEYYENGTHSHPSMHDLPLELQKYVTWRTYHKLQINANYPELLQRCLSMLKDDKASQVVLSQLRDWQTDATEFWHAVWPELKEALQGKLFTNAFVVALQHCVLRAVDLDATTSGVPL